MDKLEDYIRNNRNSLDLREPSPKVWNRIQAKLVIRRKPVFIWTAAASLVLVTGIAAAFIYFGGSKRNMARQDEIILRRNPQLRETEYYYNNLVKSLSDEANPLLVGYPDLRKELSSDMARIDSICADIKKDLRDNVSNQQVIQALINNYRIKTEILQEMLDLLREEQKPKEKPVSHEI